MLISTDPNRLYKGFVFKDDRNAGLSEKCKKGVKKRAEGLNFKVVIIYCWLLGRETMLQILGPHLLWITL